MLGIMAVWGFLPNSITQKPAPIQKYWLGIAKPKYVFRLILNPSNKLWNFKVFYLTEFSNWLTVSDWLADWCLQPSITQQWKGLQASFLHCSTLLHPETCHFANRSSHIVSIMVLPLSSSVPVYFADNVQYRFVIVQNGFSRKQHGFIAEKYLTLLFVCNAV